MDEQLKIIVGADVTNGVQGLRKFEQELVQTGKTASTTAQVTQASFNKIQAGAEQVAAKSSRNFTGLSRVIQDLPFGFIAISNNLEQLIPAAAGAGLAFSGLIAALSFAQIGFANWTRGMNFASTSLSEHARALRLVQEEYDILNKIQGEANSNASEQTTKLSLLYNATQDLSKSIKERTDATERLKATYPDTFANLTNETILAGKAEGAYRALAAQIVNTARAEAGIKQLSDLGAKRLEIEERRQKIINATNAELARVKPVSGENFLGEKVVSQESIRQKLEYDRNVIIERRNKALAEEDRKLEDIGKKEKFITDVVGGQNLIDVGKTKAAGDSINGLKDRLAGLKAQFEALSPSTKDYSKISSDLIKQIKALELQIKGAEDTISISGGGRKQKGDFGFLFDFLPFDPNGKLKPDQQRKLEEATKKFSANFKNILEGIEVDGKLISLPKTLAEGLDFNKALGKGLPKLKMPPIDVEAEAKIVPKDMELGGDVFNKLLNTAEQQLQQQADQKPFGVTVTGFINTNFSRDQILDDFKNQFAALGAELPKVIEETDFFGRKTIIPLNLELNTVALRKGLDKAKDDLVGNINKFGADMSAAIQQAFVVGFSGLGDAIGTAITGGNLEDVFKGIFQSLGGIIRSLGVEMIALSPLVQALKVAIHSLNPAGLLAAGIGLVALGTVISSSFSKAKKFSKGGIVPGHGNGDTVPAMLTPGELVIPKDKVSQVQKFLSGVSLKLPTGNFASSFKDTINSLQLGPERTAPISRASGMVGAFTRDVALDYLPKHELSGSTLRLWYARANKEAGRLG